MNWLKLKRVVAKILIISIIFTSLPFRQFSTAWATSVDPQDPASTPSTKATNGLTEEQRAMVREDILNFINQDNKNAVRKYEVDSDDGSGKEYVYAIEMPRVPGNPAPQHGNIVYDSANGLFVYQLKENGTVVKSIPFNVDVAYSQTGNLNAGNYNQYMVTSGSILETNNEFIKIIADSEDNLSGNIVYVATIAGDSEEAVSNVKDVNPPKEGFKFSDITGAIGGFFDWLIVSPIKALVSKIIGKLLIWIAYGIEALVKGIFGDFVTIYQIIFEKVPKLSINYWDSGAEGLNIPGLDAPAPVLKDITSYWYGIFRDIVVLVYLVMLLYIAVRILLSSTGKASQKYKEMLKSWVIGIIILFFFPYVMRYTIIANNSLVAMIEDMSINNADGETMQFDTMLEVRREAEKNNNIVLILVYMIMLGQLIVLLGVYYKRVFMTAFLITIFPIVAGLYIWEKTAKGGSKALSAWTREFVVLVLTQSFHAVIYVVLVDGAYKAFSRSGNWFIFILSVMFLFEAEKIIRSIFGMKSSAGTITELATAGASAWAASKMVKNVFAKDKSKNTDEADKKEAEKEITAAKKEANVNNALNATNLRTGSTIGGSSGSSSTPPPATSLNSDEASALHAAQAVVTNEALKGKTKSGIIAKAFRGTTKVATRATGITLGMTSGLASGSVTQGLSNAVLANEFSGMLSRSAVWIGGYAKGAFAGKVLKRKIISGELDDEFKKVGLDLDSMPTAKANLLRQALAGAGDAARRAGAKNAEIKLVKVIDKNKHP